MQTKFESTVRQIDYPQQAVYDILSDLNNIERVKDRIPEDKAGGLTFDKDSIAISAPMVGDIRMNIVEREEPKCIKFESVQSPVPFNFWIQVVAVSDEVCKMKLTLRADINPFLKGMVKGPLEEGIEKMADMLQAIKYQ